jgi:hypothetical protein
MISKALIRIVFSDIFSMHHIGLICSICCKQLKILLLNTSDNFSDCPIAYTTCLEADTLFRCSKTMLDPLVFCP